MKIEGVTCIWMYVYAMNFWAVRNVKKWNFRLFRPSLRELGLFYPYFVCSTERTLFRVSMMKTKKLHSYSVPKTILFRKWGLKWDHWLINRCFLNFSIVIDYYKRTSLRACKKKNYDENFARDMYLSAMNFELPEMTKKLSFRLFTPNLPQVGLFQSYFVCKSSFRVISMIKFFILDQSR